jgi:hypothetical protein
LEVEVRFVVEIYGSASDGTEEAIQRLSTQSIPLAHASKLSSFFERGRTVMPAALAC